MLSKNKKLKIALGIKLLKNLKELQEQKIEEDRRIERKRKAPSFWVNPFLIQRSDHDIEMALLKNLYWGSGSNFKNFTRMHFGEFEEVLALVEYAIKKQNTVLREAVSSRVRLAVTLRFIASGDNYRSLEYLSRVSYKTISKFVPEVLQAIWNALKPKVPQTIDEWCRVAEGFNKKWQFPHTLGAIDGKHICIKAPPHSGSNFYCYKGHFSIILFAIVDAHGKFMYIDVGSNGRINDSTIYKDSSFYEALTKGVLDIPSPAKLPGQDLETSFFFIGDDAFPLSRNLLKPFNRNISLSVAQKVFNYRLCRARMIVECAFGRLVARFRIFHRPIENSLDTTDLIVKATCALHNFLTHENFNVIQENDIVRNRDLHKHIGPIDIQYVESNNSAASTRKNIVKYLMSDGIIEGQWKHID